jgi:glutathione peroxidase
MKALLAVAAAAIMLAMAHISLRAEPAGAFDYKFEAIEGGKLPLAQWRGKVLLIVNTASFCGYTPQYEGLQAIQAFCKGAYNVTFPLTTKVDVKGGEAHPFYRWARSTLGAASAPSWNFHKYLVGRDGKLVAGYGSSIEPLSAELTRAIEAALAKP